MSVENEDVDPAILSIGLLRAGAQAELRLLKDERKASKRLAEARAVLEREERRLLRAQQRVARGGAAVAAAEESLRTAQNRRAAGPTYDHD